MVIINLVPNVCYSDIMDTQNNGKDKVVYSKLKNYN